MGSLFLLGMREHISYPSASFVVFSINDTLFSKVIFNLKLVTEEDEFGVYSNIILKLYLAEGVVSDHTFLLASQDIDFHKLVSSYSTQLVMIFDYR